MSDKQSTDLGDAFPRSAEGMRALGAAGAEAARDLCALLDHSPTPYHAAREATVRLSKAGFSELSEREAWTLSVGDRRWLVRNDGTVVAFIVGTESPAVGGFRLIGAHTDSPNLRVKPHADVYRH